MPYTDRRSGGALWWSSGATWLATVMLISSAGRTRPSAESAAATCSVASAASNSSPARWHTMVARSAASQARSCSPSLRRVDEAIW